jgi:repressor LexA
MTELTPRQKQVLAFVKRYWAKEGISPTVREIGAGLGIASPNGVLCHLGPLEKKGAIRRTKGIPRSIRVLTPDG